MIKKILSNFNRLNKTKVKNITKIRNEINSSFDESSLNSQNKIEDVFKKYYGRINKKINR